MRLVSALVTLVLAAVAVGDPVAQTSTVPAGGDLQSALNQARPFNAPRDSGILPGVYRWDMRFNKDIHLSRNNDAFRLGFSVVAANLLNHTNLNTPNPVVYAAAIGDPSPTAGLITSTTTTSRQIQLGLKLLW